MGGEDGAGAADGTQSLQTLAGASKAWDLCKENGPDSLGSGALGYWNHFEGHVFSERQWEGTYWWFDHHFRLGAGEGATRGSVRP